MADDFPRIVTRDELRFDIKFALMQISRAQWREWILGKQLQSEQARGLIVDQIAERFARYQVRAPAPMQPSTSPPEPGKSS